MAATKRATNTRERVLTTAARILRGQGYPQLTMERVSDVSGVAKTTLYRHWPTKAALCMDLYLDLAKRELDVPDTGHIATDLKEITNTVVRLQTRTVAGPALFGIIAEALTRPERRAALLAEFAERRRSLTRTVLKRAIDRGQIRAGTDIDLLIDALGGAVTFRLLQGHAPLTPKFTDALVDLLLRGCIEKEGR